MVGCLQTPHQHSTNTPPKNTLPRLLGNYLQITKECYYKVIPMKVA